MKVSANSRITFGLVSLTIGMIVIADMLGLTNTENRDVQHGAQKTGEVISYDISKPLANNRYFIVKKRLRTYLNNNKKISAIRVKRPNGDIILEVSKKAELSLYQKLQKHYHFRLDILKNNIRSSVLEIEYKSPHSYQVAGISFNKNIIFVMFISILCFVAFSLFLKRVFVEMNPASALPGRVKKALDLLTECVILLDPRMNILMVNSSFVEKTGFTLEDVASKSILDLGWENKNPYAKLPWDEQGDEASMISGYRITLQDISNNALNFVINCSPILDEEGTQTGILVTLDDVTEIEKKNDELKVILTDLQRSKQEIEHKNKELKVLADRDSLTNCYNRRAFYEKSMKFLEEGKRVKSNICCIMMDIDHFKKINDNHGHTTGDEVLVEVSKLLEQQTRDTDLFCRYGGEEFCILMLNTTLKTARTITERIRKKIQQLDIRQNENGNAITVTSSFGLADTNNANYDITKLIDAADKLLYVAKEKGRDRVVAIEDTLDGKSAKESIAALNNDDQFNGSKIRRNLAKTLYRDELSNEIEALINQDDAACFALAVIDVNMFKRINIALGHHAGDRVISITKKRLESVLRKTDSIIEIVFSKDSKVIHIGGSEFFVIIKGIVNGDKVPNLLKRLTTAVTRPYKVFSYNIQPTCNIGYSVYPSDSKLPEELMKQAEIALTHAKNSGRNWFYRYENHLDTSSGEHLELEFRVMNALRQNELELFYQPKIELKTKGTVGLEALLRWKHSEKFNINIMDFIHIAEETGQIIDIGHWVLREACLQTRKWLDKGYDITTSVNISPLQFKENLIEEKILNIIKSTGCPYSNIELEITENAVMENLYDVIEKLKKLHDKGVKISIDDFGKGYSSLSHIKNLPFDVIKIDRLFIEKITSNPEDIAIVSAIIDMGHALHKIVLAEGVSESAQINILTELECDEIQGFLISKPKPAGVVEEFLVTSYPAKTLPQQRAGGEQ